MTALRRVTGPQLRFLDEVEVIRETPASEAGSLAFLSRVLVQANLPYRQLPGETFQRFNGALTLTLQAPPQIGLPYGRYPRLLLAWLGTEAVRTKSPRLELGDSLSAYLRELGITPSGGPRGPLGLFRDQMRRLFNTTVTYSWSETRRRGTRVADAGYRITTDSLLWWEPDSFAGGQLTLSEPFYRELVAHPVPVDYRVLRALSSPLAIDIYAWLVYRTFTQHDTPVSVPWAKLAQQFGTSGQRVRKFRENFQKALGAVQAAYPGARVEIAPTGVTVSPTELAARRRTLEVRS
jgi:Plasmid encoded RepA protein